MACAVSHPFIQVISGTFMCDAKNKAAHASFVSCVKTTNLLYNN